MLESQLFHQVGSSKSVCSAGPSGLAQPSHSGVEGKTATGGIATVSSVGSTVAGAIPCPADGKTLEAGQLYHQQEEQNSASATLAAGVSTISEIPADLLLAAFKRHLPVVLPSGPPETMPEAQ
ncbi:unnamed protein product [Protopolystoma xenopodis]|uniref:Uncharacterized protein n=1 Tax=Protopolystoma xenopodis TaxID=117903 RepID=A0A448WEH9_9PLAT|nr:unnamed protein product [Protopolystoma xenopodis]